MRRTIGTWSDIFHASAEAVDNSSASFASVDNLPNTCSNATPAAACRDHRTEMGGEAASRGRPARGRPAPVALSAPGRGAPVPPRRPARSACTEHRRAAPRPPCVRRGPRAPSAGPIPGRTRRPDGCSVAATARSLAPGNTRRAARQRPIAAGRHPRQMPAPDPHHPTNRTPDCPGPRPITPRRIWRAIWRGNPQPTSGNGSARCWLGGVAASRHNGSHDCAGHPTGSPRRLRAGHP